MLGGRACLPQSIAPDVGLTVRVPVCAEGAVTCAVVFTVCLTPMCCRPAVCQPPRNELQRPVGPVLTALLYLEICFYLHLTHRPALTSVRQRWWLLSPGHCLAWSRFWASLEYQQFTCLGHEPKTT